MELYAAGAGVGPDQGTKLVVIGRQGRTAKALRTVVGALAEDGPVRIDVVDTDRTR